MSAPSGVWLFAVAVMVLAGTAACDSGNEVSAPPDLTGTWAVTEVQGAPGPVDASNSTWTFRADGTYDWFFFYPGFFDLEGSGTYVLEDNILTVTGIFANTVISESPDGRVALSSGNNTFSFRDDDGDRWTYFKVQ
jgi:hypothetical protein